MNNEQIHQDIGGLKAEVKGLRREVTAMGAKLDTIAEYVAQQKGAKRATLFIATGSGSIFGALAALAVSWFK